MNNNQQLVMQYIENQGIKLKKSNTILVEIDRSCNMAAVSLNKKCLMMGNNWDFHPGCHGMAVPNFRTYTELSYLFKDALIAAGKKVEVVYDKEWKFE